MSLIGCYATADLATEPVTKTDAALTGGRSDKGEDLCAKRGWYDDGVCDDFCPDVDDDCAVCLAIPTCGDEATPYDSLAACEAAGHSTCEENSLCGTTVYCGSDLAVCLAIPTCDDGTTPYDSLAACEAAGHSTCAESSMCGTTIYCGSDHFVCLAIPSCDPGQTQHTDPSECPADAACIEVTMCGVTIWCSGSSDAPCIPNFVPKFYVERLLAMLFSCNHARHHHAFPRLLGFIHLFVHFLCFFAFSSLLTSKRSSSRPAAFLARIVSSWLSTKTV
jgi:hypothetical protein